MAGKFEIKKSDNGKFHFHLKAGNGQVVLTSQMYVAKKGAQEGISSIQKAATSDARFDRKKSVKDQPYFVVKSANGEVIATSQMYASPSAMENGVKSVKANGPSAKTVDLSEKEVKKETKKVVAKETKKKK